MKDFDVSNPETYKYNQDCGFTPLDKVSIVCEGCPYKAEDVVLDGRVLIEGARKGFCQKFDSKPVSYLMKENSFCKYRHDDK